MKEISRGIDVSHWQGNFDWSAAKSEGYNFGVIKAGGGDGGLYKDVAFERNYNDAKAQGMNVGAYFYSGAKTVEAAEKEANYFADILTGKQFELPVYVDVEDKGMLALGQRALTDIVKAFCDRMEKRGWFVGIYSSLSYFRNKMLDDELQGYAHWVAQWGERCTYANESVLGMWQNSSSNTVAGVRCDTDVLYVDYPAIMKQKGLNGFTAHTHSWQYVADTVNHCLECVGCGERKDVAPHVLKPMSNATHHFKQCVVCGANVQWEKHYGGKADCIHKAVCESCGESYGEVDKNNHTGKTKVVGAVSATTEKEGYTGDTVCADCGAIIKQGEAIPKLLKDPDGDVNGDGKVDVKDLVRLLKAVANGESDEKLDVNGDGMVDIRDIIRLMKELAK